MTPDQLMPHPEGGRFREVFRSASTVDAEGNRRRSALTHIYFELGDGDRSRFHRVRSDEVWNLYRGNGVRLVQWDGLSHDVEVIELVAIDDSFCHVVPAGMWQAAEPIDGPVLVGCSVGPGFDFEDFEMIDPDSDIASHLMEIDDRLKRFIVA